MSFHLTAENIEIRDNHILYALLRNEDGEMRESEIDLDEVIVNENGQFEWDGVNFSETAADVECAIEGGGEAAVLWASLQAEQGEWVTSDINLAEPVFNINGTFCFL